MADKKKNRFCFPALIHDPVIKKKWLEVVKFGGLFQKHYR